MSMAAPTAKALRGAALALVLALAACTATPELQHATLPMPKPAQAEMASAAQRENARILGSYGGVYENARLQQMVDKLVNRLVAASERPDLKYKVTILNSPAINAFALPNGQLYVTRGLIALANDEAELSSVLAHEMGHVIARHAQIREEQVRDAELASRTISNVVNDPQMSALALAKSKLTIAAFSRAQEFEADGIGVGITARAGLDPYGASRMLADMRRNADFNSGGDNNSRAADFLSNHPSTPERIRNAITDARRLAGPGIGARDRDQYLADLDGAVYGEDPSEGYVRGRRFIHSKLGFTFLAPPGFTLDNTAQAVLGLKDGGAEALRLDVVSVPAEQSLTDYLKSGWMENIDRSSLEDFALNGFPAAGASATGKDWSFRLFVVRFGSDVYRFIYAAKHMTPQVEASFKQSIDTFRRMSLKEAAEAKPLHVKIVSVGAHDTVASLARRMAVSDHRLERFRVLNGLGPRDPVKPGTKVKIVVE
jgi:predicted Zn-dependent protease